MTISRPLLICLMLATGATVEVAAAPLSVTIAYGAFAVASAQASQPSILLIGARGGQRAGKRSAKRVTSANRFRGDESKVSQISPTILRSRSLRLEGYDRGLVDRDRDNRSTVEDLVDALIQAPSARTRKTLAAVGLPAFKDVPPIVVLRGPVKHPRQDEENFDDLLQ